MPAFAGAIEARATREDQVGCIEELHLVGGQGSRCTLKGGEFIHAVVHDSPGLKLAYERHRHRRVKPCDESANPVVPQELREELALPQEALLRVFLDMHLHNEDAVTGLYLQVHRVAAGDGFFDVEDTA